MILSTGNERLVVSNIVDCRRYVFPRPAFSLCQFPILQARMATRIKSEKRTLGFIKSLKRNNSCGWFQKNYPAYEVALANETEWLNVLIA